MEKLIIIGDTKQLAVTVMTNKDINQMVNIQGYSILQTGLDMGVVSSHLTEQMRMAVGLMDCTNVDFYDEKLTNSPGTEPATRPLALHFKQPFNERSTMIPEPENSIHSLFLKIEGHCFKEQNGTLRITPTDNSAGTDMMDLMLSNVPDFRQQ